MDEDRRLIRKNLNLAWHELYDHNNNVIEGMWGILMRLPTSSFPLTGQLLLAMVGRPDENIVV